MDSDGVFACAVKGQSGKGVL